MTLITKQTLTEQGQLLDTYFNLGKHDKLEIRITRRSRSLDNRSRVHGSNSGCEKSFMAKKTMQRTRIRERKCQDQL